MRTLIETWGYCSRMNWKSRSTPLPAALCPRIGCLWPSTASQTSPISRRLAPWRRYIRDVNQLLQRDICADTQSVVASVGPPRAAMSLVAASEVPRQVSVRAASCLLPAVVDGHQVPELAITSSEFGTAHSLPVYPQSLSDPRKLAVALSKVSRDTWQK